MASAPALSPRQPRLRRVLAVAGQIAVFYAIYFVFFGRRFFDGSVIFVGDSHGTISLNNLAAYSLVRYGELLWWDPTTLGGYPALVNLTAGWFNLLSPLALPGNLFVWFAERILHWPITLAVQVQLSSIAYLTALVFVILLARELIRLPVARLIPPLVFTLGVSSNQIFMLSQHGPALAPSLAYLYGLVYFWRRRAPAGLFVLLAFTTCWLAAFNYITFSSHMFPLLLATVLLVALDPGFVVSAWHALVATIATVRGRLVIGFGLAACLLAVLDIVMVLHYFADEVIRVGGALKPFDYGAKGLEGLATPPGWGIVYQKLFLGFNAWFPFDDAYAFALIDEPWNNLTIPRMDMRYIGAFTLPLIVAAVALGRRSALILALFVAYFIATFVLPYVYKLEPFSFLLDYMPLLRNVRALANTMPRDIPTVLAALLAGVGLEALLVVRRRLASHVLLLAAVAAGLIAGAFVIVPAFAPVRHSLAHIAVYLVLAALILLGLLASSSPAVRRRLAIVFLLIAGTDLAVSSSFYFQRIVLSLPREPAHMLPDAARFGPIRDERENWFGAYTHGYVHATGPAINFGLRSWLVLATRRDWRPVLENWNARSGRMTEYPALRFYSSATFLPFAQIAAIDKLGDMRPVVLVGNRIVTLGEATASDATLQPGTRFAFIGKGYARLERTRGLECLQSSCDISFSVEFGRIEPGSTSVLVGQSSAGEPGWHLLYASGKLILQTDGGAIEIAAPFAPIPGHSYRIAIAHTEQGVALSIDGDVIGTGKTSPLQDVEHPLTIGGRAGAIENPFRGRISELTISRRSGTRAVEPPDTSSTFYVHDQAALEGLALEPRKLEPTWQLIRFEPNRVQFAVEMPAPGLALHLDNFDPFWRARVNGRERPLYRANFTFKALRLPAGPSVVELVYDPYPIRWGWTAFYLAFGAMLISVVVPLPVRRKPSTATPIPRSVP